MFSNYGSGSRSGPSSGSRVLMTKNGKNFTAEIIIIFFLSKNWNLLIPKQWSIHKGRPSYRKLSAFKKEHPELQNIKFLLNAPKIISIWLCCVSAGGNLKAGGGDAMLGLAGFLYTIVSLHGTATFQKWNDNLKDLSCMTVQFSLQVLKCHAEIDPRLQRFYHNSSYNKKLYLYKTYLHDVVAILCLLNAGWCNIWTATQNLLYVWF